MSAPTANAPAKKAPAKAPRLEQLDAFRLIVIAVITFHTLQHSDLGGGVVLPAGTAIGSIIGNIDFLLAFYFLMSGFAIAVTVLRTTIEGKPLPATGDYVGKRLVRLVPLYLVVFLTVWELRYAGTEKQWADFFWGVTLMQSWSTDHIFATIDPAWYLSVEIGFLIATVLVVLPVLRRIGRLERREARMRGVIAVAVGAILVSALWKLGLTLMRTEYDEWGRWFAPPAWMDLWGIGMLFGLAVMKWARADQHAPRWAPMALVVASLTWLWTLVVLADDEQLPRSLRWVAASAGVLGLMVASIMAPPERITRRVMASKPVQRFGSVSFGMFLVHAPILRYLSSQEILPLHTTEQWVLSTVALTALSGVIGAFTLRFIETPALGLVRLHLPERARRWHEARPIKPTLREGMPAPEVLSDLFEPVPGPLVVLVAPASRLRSPSQRDPGMNGFLELFANRFLIDGVGGKAVGLVGRDPVRKPLPQQKGDVDSFDLEMSGLPGEEIVKRLGIGGHKLRGGAIVPERTAIVVAPSGIVIGVLRMDNGIDLARAAIDLAVESSFSAPPEPEPLRLVA